MSEQAAAPAPAPGTMELDFSKSTGLPSVSSAPSDRSLTVVGPDGEQVVLIRLPKDLEARVALADLLRKHLANAAAGVWL